MTEKEKRDKGELYNLANSAELMLEIKMGIHVKWLNSLHSEKNNI